MRTRAVSGGERAVTRQAKRLMKYDAEIVVPDPPRQYIDKPRISKLIICRRHMEKAKKQQFEDKVRQRKLNVHPATRISSLAEEFKHSAVLPVDSWHGVEHA